MVKPVELTADILAIGAGVAGAAAAIAVRRRGRNVAIVERGALPRAGGGPLWVSPAAAALAQDLGVDFPAIGGAPYQGLALDSHDFSQQVVINDAELAGWIVARDRLEDALLNQAREIGAEVHAGVEIRQMIAHDTHVELLDTRDRRLSAQVALLAPGDRPTASALLSAPIDAVTPPTLHCIATTLRATESSSTFRVVLGAGAFQAATITRHGERTRVELSGRDPAELPAALEQLLERAQSAGVLPADLTVERQSPAQPLGVALDLETHVAKRALVIGQAGGFQALLSAEDLYPGLRSASIAADVAHAALDAAVPQEILSGYGVAWRGELAGYLRLPNADLSLLLPLVFKNENMSRRIGRAFLLGRDF